MSLPALTPALSLGERVKTHILSLWERKEVRGFAK
jgi:hypothetical protein